MKRVRPFQREFSSGRSCGEFSVRSCWRRATRASARSPSLPWSTALSWSLMQCLVRELKPVTKTSFQTDAAPLSSAVFCGIYAEELLKNPLLVLSMAPELVKHAEGESSDSSSLLPPTIEPAIATETKTQPKPKIACDVCHQTFSCSVNLRRHHRVGHCRANRRRAPYACAPTAEEAQAFPGDYPCLTCGHLFNRKDNLSRHMREVCCVPTTTPSGDDTRNSNATTTISQIRYLLLSAEATD